MDENGAVTHRYPTIAGALVNPADVILVETFSCDLPSCKHRSYEITNQEALDCWLRPITRIDRGAHRTNR